MEITQDSNFQRFSTSKNIQMGLNTNSVHTIMTLLRNSIYSDPIESFVREIFSNAVDANIRAGRIHKGVDITINFNEDTYSGEYIVRDYGDSMDVQTIEDIYSKLGNSDKTDTNEELGGFGIGSASPLAYTDHFFIETWTQEGSNSYYRKWVQYIDSSRIGDIGLQEEREFLSNEELGTKVTVPFKGKDRTQIVFSISKYLHYTKSPYRIHNFETNYCPIFYNHYGDCWAFRMVIGPDKHSRPNMEAIAVVGDIPYNIEVADLMTQYIPKLNHELQECSQFQRFLTAICYYNWEVYLPIGSIDLSASRESLQYTDRTVAALLSCITKMYHDINDICDMEVVYTSTFYEACSNYTKKFGKAFKEYYFNKVKWYKGDSIVKSSLDLVPDDTIGRTDILKYKLERLFAYEPVDKDRRLFSNKDYSVYILDESKFCIVIQDTDYKSYTKFIKYFINSREDIDIVYLVPKYLEDKLNDWTKEKQKVIYLSSVAEEYKKEQARKRREKANNTVKEKKVKNTDVINILQYVDKCERSRADGFGVYFEPSSCLKEPPIPYYYIIQEEVDNQDEFDFDYRDQVKLNHLKNYLRHGSVNRNEFYMIKKVTKTYNHPNWINFLDVLRNDVKKCSEGHFEFMTQFFIKCYCESQMANITLLKDEVFAHPQSRYAKAIRKYIGACHYIDHKKFEQDLYKFIDEGYRRMLNKSQSRVSQFCLNEDELDSLTSDKNLQVQFCNIAIEFQNLVEDYPMVKHINETYYSYSCSVEEFVDYIDLVESKDKEKEDDLSSSQETKIEINKFEELVSYYTR